MREIQDFEQENDPPPLILPKELAEENKRANIPDDLYPYP